MAVMASFAILGLLVVVLIAAGFVMVAKLHWRSNAGDSVDWSAHDLNDSANEATPLVPSPPAALLPPDDLASLDRGMLVIRLHTLLTGNGAGCLGSLGSCGIFHTRSGTRITVFHSDDKLCVVVIARDLDAGKVWRIVHSLNELFALFAVEDLQPPSGDDVGAIPTSQALNTSIDGLVKMPAEALRILLEELSVSYAVAYLK